VLDRLATQPSSLTNALLRVPLLETTPSQPPPLRFTPWERSKSPPAEPTAACSSLADCRLPPYKEDTDLEGCEVLRELGRDVVYGVEYEQLIVLFVNHLVFGDHVFH